MSDEKAPPRHREGGGLVIAVTACAAFRTAAVLAALVSLSALILTAPRAIAEVQRWSR